MTPRTRGGFTLVEVVVVIGIILFLVGLTLSVSVSVIERSEIQQTETVLQILDTAVQEWELLAERKLSWWEWGDSPSGGDQWSQADIHADTEEVFIITEVLETIARSSQVKQIIAQVGPELFYTYQLSIYPEWIDAPQEEQQQDALFVGGQTILDAWGTPIYATHPGRLFNSGTDPGDPDPDGTIQTYNEYSYGAAPNRQLVFVSAGPDQLFGLPAEFGLGSDLEAAIRQARADNIFSTSVKFVLYP
ncbi:MAG: prepilin-type N-terminal cleavage/methylation domain-containing protein [Planctomycetes bacterium]|nr:prepilin-type N-terminal cleavage/methylation domain-containing protein [Planctomycetota bacterium]